MGEKEWVEVKEGIEMINGDKKNKMNFKKIPWSSHPVSNSLPYFKWTVISLKNLLIYYYTLGPLPDARS